MILIIEILLIKIQNKFDILYKSLAVLNKKWHGFLNGKFNVFDILILFYTSV